MFTPLERPEGVGARVKRIIGGSELRNFDPFLMLDLFNVKLPAGFPDHPHRGFETVTYMLSGEIHHEDFKGHKGVIGPGDIQWMTAGKGILHAEMPGSFDTPSYGFQLWINLMSKDKYCEPQYQEFYKKDIPVHQADNMSAKVIAGEVFGVKGPIHTRTPAYFIDFTLTGSGKEYTHVIPANWNAMVFVYEGSLEVQEGKKAAQFTNVVFNASSTEGQIKVKSVGETAKFILLAGTPMGEKMVQHGPFVLNT